MYVVALFNAAVGCKVAVMRSVDKVIVAGTITPFGSVSTSVVEGLNEIGSIALENMTFTVAFVGTEVAPLAGITDTNDGCVRSIPVEVVNELVDVPLVALPCTSVTPVTEIV